MTYPQAGHTLVEMMAALAVLGMLLAIGAPLLGTALVQVEVEGVARRFEQEFLLARSVAVRSGRQTAIRFERDRAGIWFVSVYSDGNGNGVLSCDIDTGRDLRLSGPRRLDAGAAHVRVGINPGVPEPPPGRGTLDTSDPIRFGRAEMLSFSPLGTATPGTFYLAGSGVQAAVRVVPGSARVRLLVWHGGRWQES